MTPSGQGIEWGGLNLSRLDEITHTERQAFSEFYTRRFDHPHTGLEFMLDERPDALKRFRLFVYNYEASEPARKWGFAFMVYYALIGYSTGVRYTIRQRQRQGMTAEEVRDAIAISFLRTGPYGAETMARGLEGYEWLHPDERMELPEGWDRETEALRAGLDFDNPELAPGEVERLRMWYLGTIGEVPPYVDYLASHDPRTLKAIRGRWENTVTALPKQSLPYTLLGFDALRGSRHGMRENALLCRAWGVSKSAAIGAISAAMEYGGPDNVARAAEATADVFDNWE